jgi:hypothetical protein
MMHTWKRLAATVLNSICLKHIALAAIVLVTAGTSAHGGDKSQSGPQRFFEMRTYTCYPGKLDALNKRFRDHTNRLFEKHGMELIGFWTPVDAPEKENTLVYILAFPSREARDKAFEAFRADPQWQAARDASERTGKIVEKVESKFLNPTDYSKIK